MNHQELPGFPCAKHVWPGGSYGISMPGMQFWCPSAEDHFLDVFQGCSAPPIKATHPADSCPPRIARSSSRNWRRSSRRSMTWSGAWSLRSRWESPQARSAHRETGGPRAFGPVALRPPDEAQSSPPVVHLPGPAATVPGVPDAAMSPSWANPAAAGAPAPAPPSKRRSRFSVHAVVPVEAETGQ